jgi:hypothetical protein
MKRSMGLVNVVEVVAHQLRSHESKQESIYTKDDVVDRSIRSQSALHSSTYMHGCNWNHKAKHMRERPTKDHTFLLNPVLLLPLPLEQKYLLLHAWRLLYLPIVKLF